MKLLALAVLTLAAMGCGLLDRKKERPPRPTVQTPYGYVVAPLEDRGGISGGWFTEAQAHAWLDRRVDEWARVRNPENPEGLKAAVRGDVGFILVDDRRIETPHSKTGYAAGEYIHGQRTVIACIWHTKHGPALPPDAPAHTADRNPADGLWYWGVLPAAGGLRVVAHELDHYIGIHHD